MPQAELGHCWLQGQAAEWAALLNPPLCCQLASQKLHPSLPRRRHRHQQGQPQPPSSSQPQPLCSRFAHCEFREVLAALLGAAGRLLQPLLVSRAGAPAPALSTPQPHTSRQSRPEAQGGFKWHLQGRHQAHPCPSAWRAPSQSLKTGKFNILAAWKQDPGSKGGLLGCGAV